MERPNVVLPLTTNGSPQEAATANYLIFDDSFSASIESRMWGAEATILTKSYVPYHGFGWQWLGGFRYLSYEEDFNISGTIGDDLATPEMPQIGGRTTNNLYGPQFGARASIKNRWFTLSATPRVAFTLNNFSARTQSSTAESAFVRTTVGDEDDVEFTPIVQLSYGGF